VETRNERRTEQRLSYQWPIWFANGLSDGLIQGQMADVSSRGAAFTCYTDEQCPGTGEQITARFSVPDYGPDESFGMKNFIRLANVCRVEEVNSFIRRIAVQFAQPLPFRPGERTEATAGLEPEPSRL